MIIRFLCGALCVVALPVGAGPIRVVVWDEQQPEQKKAYPHFLGQQIAEHLQTFSQFTVKAVGLNDPEQGLSDAVLDHCDVLIWWGHVRNNAISNAKAKEIVRRIREGKLSLVALHSAHWSEPFVEAMNERTREDVRKAARGKEVEFEFIAPERFRAPQADAPLTPRVEAVVGAGEKHVWRVYLPNCCFPSFRPDGAPSHVTTLLPDHPLARGVPRQFDVSQTEMYNEPFHVPTPDEVVFEETWDRGERFRSGCVWKLGKGRVFYFRPGHEVYPVYLQETPLRIIRNAADWLGGMRP